MCGINGFTGREEQLIQRMNDVTRHRGPDGSHVWLADEMTFGHNRLSIIDLSHDADQPMISNDGALVIVFNGEIYNFQALKDVLSREYSFRTTSDTEVILAAYQKWGRECVKKMNGMFAFALWDKARKELFLARDPVGVKPLYYAWHGSRFIFSSEIKGILEHPIPRVCNMDAFNAYMRLLYVPEPLTMFEGIYKLPRGTHAVVKDGAMQIARYADDEIRSPIASSFTETARELERGVQQAVERQLISDRPVGVYLSGGIDSSVVLDCMAQARGNIDTFSVGFDLEETEGRRKFNYDFEIAKKTAAYYGTRHHEVLVSSDDVVALLPKLIWHMDEPISKATAVAMMKIAKTTKDTVAVVLGGDGGDELFGGYDRYRLSVWADTYQTLPHMLRRVLNQHPRLRKLDMPAGLDRYALFMFQKNPILERLVSSQYLNNYPYEFFQRTFFDRPTSRDSVEQIMDTDQKSWLVDDSLVLTDKMTMSAGLEGRVPFLDQELVALAARIPRAYKVDRWQTKKVLKAAFRDRIPPYLFNEPKRGWYAPGAKWLRRGNVARLLEEALNSGYYEGTKDLFRWDEVARVRLDHESKKDYNLTVLWALFTFQLWAKMFKISFPKK